MTTGRRKPAIIDLGPSDEQLRDEFWDMARRALDALPPTMPGTFPAADHELDCFTVATAITLAQRLGLDTPALTA